MLDFEDMSNLPKDLIQGLKSNFDTQPMLVDVFQQSSDGTIKVGFKTFDRNTIASKSVGPNGMRLPNASGPLSSDFAKNVENSHKKCRKCVETVYVFGGIKAHPFAFQSCGFYIPHSMEVATNAIS